MKKLLAISSILSLFLGVSTVSAIGFAPNLGVATNYSRFDTENDENAVAQAIVQAYNQADSQSCDDNISGESLNRTLAPGVYCFNSNAVLDGTLRLDGMGNQNAVFIFSIEDNLEIKNGADVVLQGGTRPENVFWQVGNTAALGADSNVSGTIMAKDDIALGGNADLFGRALSINGRVSLSGSATIACPSCTIGGVIGNTIGGTLTCSPNPATTVAGQPITLTARGGDGSYTWSGTNLQVTNPFGTGFTVRYNQAGTYNVTVRSNNQIASCAVIVTGGSVLGTSFPGLPNTGYGTLPLVYAMWTAIAALVATHLYLSLRSR